jgi:hypothetical protein
MKHIFIFGILFCLVFLNVPRSFVHDCEEHEIVHHDSDHNDEHHSNELSFDVDTDNCFICEFDLGFFNVPEFKSVAFAKFCSYAFVAPSVDYLSPDDFNAFSHRGPPIA